MKPPLDRGNTIFTNRRKNPAPLDGGRLFQLTADLQHVGGAGPRREGQMLHHGHQRQQSEGAVQGGTRVTPKICWGWENMDR